MNSYNENDQDDEEIISSTGSMHNNSEEIFLNIENSINIDNIQEETNLNDYTEKQFNAKIQKDLEKIKDMHLDSFNNSFYNIRIESNSPITISNSGSRNNSNNNSSCSSDSENFIDYDTDNDEPKNKMYSKFKKLSYRDVEKIINKYYDLSNDTKFSTEIDILTTFIKGQKNLYIQSKNSSQRRLNCLTFPSIFISALITIVAPFIECKSWSVGFISGLNAIIMLCISLINYLKLESSIENYMYTIKQYDKLETSLDMTSNKLLFIDSDKEKSSIVLNKIRDLERKINEIKESNNMLIPEDVKQLFPIIYHINIFTFIKKIEIYKKNLIIKFKDVKNEIRYIFYKLENYKIEYENQDKYKNRLIFLYEVKDKLKSEIFDMQCAYSHIDNAFMKEIKNSENKKNMFCYILSFFPFNKDVNNTSSNSIIDKYFHFVFANG